MNLTGEIRQHSLLGQYWLFLESSEGGKVYRRADTEVDDGVFLYFHKDKWRVGDEIGRERTGTKLCNESSKQRKSNPPIHNWQEISHGLVKNSWQDCDLQLESEVDLSTCHLHVKLKTGKEKKVKGLGDKEGKKGESKNWVDIIFE